MSEQRPLRVRLAEARESHQRLVEAETLALQRLAILRDGDRNADRQKLLLQARQAKLAELVRQREVFETTVARVEAQRQFMGREEWNTRLERELFQFQCRRSVSTKRLEIEAFLSSPSRFLILHAASDSGKSTRMPQYAAMELRGRVFSLQRTQRAAREMAKRVAFEWSAGDSVSYKRLLENDTCVITAEGPEIEFVTQRELRELLERARASRDTENPLEDVCCVVLDDSRAEDHETRELLDCLREEGAPWQFTKVIALVSTKLRAVSVAEVLADAVTVKVPMLEFPTTIKYEPQHSCLPGVFADLTQLPLAVALCALRLHESHSRSDGDILCFLPSQYDALQAKSHFEQALAQAKAWSREKPKRLLSARTQLVVADQKSEDLAWMDAQDSKGKRRNVIFASDDVESWFCMDSVGVVVDSGVRYGVQYPSRDALGSLGVIPISYTTALMRTQLAARTRPGLCVRLYSESAYEGDPSTSFDQQTHADDEALWAGALRDPRLVRMVSFAAERGRVRAGIDLAVMVLLAKRFVIGTTKDVKTKRKPSHQGLNSSGDGDIVAMYRAFKEWKKMPVASMEPEPEGESASEQWCRDRGISVETMRMADHFTERLYQQASDEEDVADPGTNADLDGDASMLRRIIASGFFMNAAVRKPSSTPQTPQYFDLETGSTGLLDLSPLSTQPNRFPRAVSSVGPGRDWIVYCDQVTGDDGSPCFSLITPVEEAWILEESPDLAAKRLDLPISSCSWSDLSQELLSEVFGAEDKERDIKITQLEQTLGCALVVDGVAETVSAVDLAEKRATEVRITVEDLFEKAREELARSVLEEGYMGTTRAVLGSGFQVRELLFQDEFVSLSFQNWTHSEDSLLETISSHSQGLSDDSIEQIETRGSDTVNVRAADKHIAQKLLENLSNKNDLDGVKVVPLRSALTATHHRNVTSTFGGQIKISWADGFATGGAKLYFADAPAANAFLAGYMNTHALRGIQATPRGVLPEHKIADDVELPDLWLSTLGFGSTPDQQSSKGRLPPLRHNRGRVVFDAAAVEAIRAEEVSQLEFCVEIKKGLPLDVDEQKLVELAQPSHVVDCVIRRRKDAGKDADADLQRRIRALPLVSCLNATEEAVNWEKKKARRVGVVVAFTDLQHLEDVYAKVVKSSLWKEISDDRPCGQPIRLTVEFTFSVSIASPLFECFRETITQIVVSARAKGVKSRQKESDEVTTLKLVSRSREELRRVVIQLETAIEQEKVEGKAFSALFSLPGRLKVDEWLHKRKANSAIRSYVVRADRGQSLWVYGEKTQREKTIATLKELASQIQNDVEVLDRIVRLDVSKLSGLETADRTPKKMRKLVKRWLLSQPSVQQLFHVRVLGGRGRVALSGSQSQVDALVEKWAAQGVLLERALTVEDSGATVPDCGVCTLPVEEPVVQFAVCGHSFCLECIQPGITASTPLPLKCPTYNCGRLLHVNDVAKVTKDTAAIVESAVFDYVARHPQECVVCPKAGCNQVLSRAKIEFDDEGGQFVYCESCTETYCLACYETTGQAMKRHDATSCDEFQAGGGTATERHIKFIRDTILTLCCPHCKAAFLDFSGCASVACGNATCRRYFCACCVAFSSTSSPETHTHVSRCEKNPSNTYWVSADALNGVHRQMRVSKLREYIHSRISSSRVRRNVVQRLTKDLSDLGIPAPIDLIQDSD